MHIITPYDPWTPKKKKTWQEELWEQQEIAEIEAQMLAEAQSRTLPQNAPDVSVATAGPAVNAAGGAGGAPTPRWYSANQQVTSINWTVTPSTTGTAPVTAQFLNLSSEDALNFYTWVWNFNDGTAGSALRDPSHIFSQTGSYRVSLTGSAPDGTVTQSVKIVAVSASRPDMPPTVNFTPTATTTSYVPFDVQFTNLTANYSATNANTYKWIFSGSTTPVTPVTTSILANPLITFINTGSYSVKLELTGSWNVTESKYVLLCVSASHPTLTAGFTVTPVRAFAPSQATFINTSVYTGTGNMQVTWSYGSGSITQSAVAAANYNPPSVTYINPGRYTASLQLTESMVGLRSSYTQSWSSSIT